MIFCPVSANLILYRNAIQGRRRGSRADGADRGFMTMRTILIGDIHGCNNALVALLDKVNPTGKDTLVLLGDLFDRGPDSWEVLQTVQELAETYGDRFVLLRGNHEDYLLAEKLSLSEKMVWNRVGRGATVKSFKAHRERMEDSIPWLRENCRLWWKGDGVQAVHAGLEKDPPEENDVHTLLHDHGIVLRNGYDGPLTVVGHIALDCPTWFAGDGKTREHLQPGEWQPLPERGIICIDTGCGKGGLLTAMIIEDGRFRLECVFESERGSRR